MTFLFLFIVFSCQMHSNNPIKLDEKDIGLFTNSKILIFYSVEDDHKVILILYI